MTRGERLSNEYLPDVEQLERELWQIREGMRLAGMKYWPYDQDGNLNYFGKQYYLDMLAELWSIFDPLDIK